MKIKSIAPWFGGKRTMAPLIVRELGSHSSYWEPFCGSLAVLLVKDVVRMETVNDLNGDLINLARVLADPDLALGLYGQLSRTLMHEGLFHEAAQAWRARGRVPATGSPNAARAAEYMFCSWAGRNGVAGTASYNQGFCARYTKNGGHAATRWVSAVDSIPAWHRRLRHVTILNRDAFGLLDRIEDASGVVIYNDPPYIEKGAKYIHDFESDDHDRLATSLARFKKTRVVVSYYDHPRLAELYSGWTVVHAPQTKAMVNQGMRDRSGRTVAPEVLLINGRSHTQHIANAAANVPGQLDIYAERAGQ